MFKFLTLALFFLLVFTGCSQQEEDLVIYSGRREQFIEPILKEFSEKTGIGVRLLSGGAPEYAHRIIAEKDNPQADLFFANDAGIMEFLRIEGALQPINTESMEVIPTQFRAQDSSWIGISARSRVLMYNPDVISPEKAPQTLEDLTREEFRGKFALTRPGNASMVSHITALRAYWGEAKTADFLEQLINNDPLILHGHTDIRQAVGRGEIAIGLVNNYYYHLQLQEANNNNVEVVYPDQEEGQMGAFVNIAGVAFISGSPREEKALKLIEFMLQPEQQEKFSELSFETPLHPDVPVLDFARPIDSYKHMDVELSSLGSLWPETVSIMERVGYVD